MDDDSHRWCWGRGNAARTRIITRSLVDTLSEYWCIYIYIYTMYTVCRCMMMYVGVVDQDLGGFRAVLVRGSM